MSITKIGVLGGSFNPVHNGHLFLARYVKKICALDKIIMIPTGKHPFKNKQNVVSAEHRLAMLKLALQDSEGIEVSDIEIKSPELSYTYVTLCRLREEYGENCRIYFIIGTDELLTLERWHEAKKLLEQFSFIVGIRPNYEEHKVKEKIEYLINSYGANFELINLPAPDVSSTEIRQAVAEERNLCDSVPEIVAQYIIENSLYCMEEE